MKPQRQTVLAATRSWAPFALAAIALLTGSANAAVGAKVGLQVWDPARPQDEHVKVVYDNNSAVSDAVIKAWRQARAPLCGFIKTYLGQSNAFGAGITLYDINCELKESQEFSAREAGRNTMEFTYAVRGNSIAATSTTPDIPVVGFGAGKYADPRAGVTFDFVVKLAVAVQPGGDDTLRITEIHAHLENAHADALNFPARVVKGFNDAWAALSGTDFKARVEARLNAVSTNGGLGASLVGLANAEMAPVNAALKPASDLVKVGAWFDRGQVVLAFGPRSVPAPRAIGAVTGRVRWPTAWTANRGCASFRIVSRVQTGPSAVVSARFDLGSAPMQEFGQVITTGVPVQIGDQYECAYRLEGLPVMYANMLVGGAADLTIPGVKSADASGSVFAPITLAGLRKQGWSDPYIVPPMATANRDWVVESTHINPHLPLMETKTLARANSVDPVANKSVLGVSPTVLQPAAPIHAPAAPSAPVQESTMIKGMTVQPPSLKSMAVPIRSIPMQTPALRTGLATTR